MRWAIYTPDHEKLLSLWRRTVHAFTALTAATVTLTSEVIDLSIGGPAFSKTVMWLLAVVNVGLAASQSYGGPATRALNQLGLLLAALFAFGRAGAFLALVIDGRTDLLGAVAERMLLGLALVYPHLVSIVRPWRAQAGDFHLEPEEPSDWPEIVS